MTLKEVLEPLVKRIHCRGCESYRGNDSYLCKIDDDSLWAYGDGSQAVDVIVKAVEEWMQKEQSEDKIDRLTQALLYVDYTLRVPAAEYVPAIGDVFNIIDKALRKEQGESFGPSPMRPVYEAWKKVLTLDK